MAASNALGALAFLLASTLPELGRLVLGGFVMCLLVSRSMRRLKALEPFSSDHEEHLVERMAAFTLIVCGETFIKVAITVSHARIGSVNIVAIVVDFFLVLAIFSSYFGDFPTAGLNQRRLGWWTLLHLTAQVAIASTAAGITKVVVNSLSDAIPDSEILLLTAPFVVLLVAFAGLDLCTRRRPARHLVGVRLSGAVAYAIVGISAWKAPFIHYVEAIPLLAIVAIVEAVAVGRVEATTTVLRSERLAEGLAGLTSN
jgi:low temperature requirement protein LtrA